MKDNTITTKKVIQDITKFFQPNDKNFDQQSLKEQAYHILDYLLSEPHQTLIPESRVELLKKTVGDWKPKFPKYIARIKSNKDKPLSEFDSSGMKALYDEHNPCKEIEIDPAVHNKTFKERNPLQKSQSDQVYPQSHTPGGRTKKADVNFELNRYELEDLKDLEFDAEHNPCKEMHLPSQDHLTIQESSLDIQLRKEWSDFKNATPHTWVAPAGMNKLHSLSPTPINWRKEFEKNGKII